MSTRTLTLGHSPDPDDAFMHYALAAGRIPMGPYQFTHILQDIQTLNERATRDELDISAISIHAYAYVSDKYALLPNGASMGMVTVRCSWRDGPAPGRRSPAAASPFPAA